MVDVIDVIGDRIRYWAEQNNPGQGKASFNRGSSDLWVEFKDLQYTQPAYPRDYRIIALKSSTYRNASDVADKQVFSVNEKTTQTFSYAFKESIGSKLAVKVPLPFAGPEVPLDFTLNFESTQTQTTSTERGWVYSADVNVPPRKIVDTTFKVYQGLYDIPYSAMVQVRGTAWIDFPRRRYWRSSIDHMIKDLGWMPSTFEYAVGGTFTAVNGERYEVNKEQHDITGVADAADAIVPDVGAYETDRLRETR